MVEVGNCLDAELEEVGCCIYSMHQKMLHVSWKMIMFKAKKFLMIKPLIQPVEMLSLQAEGGVKNL